MTKDLLSLEERICAGCGTRNRVGSYGLNQIPRCAACRARLPERVSKLVYRWLYRFRFALGLIGSAGITFLALIQLPSATMGTAKMTPSAKQQTECTEYPQPRSGLYADYRQAPMTSPPMTIKTREGANYFVKFEEVGSNRPVLALFVHGGQQIKQSMPEGNFLMKYASGEKWCGEQYFFGQSTNFSQSDKSFSFDEETIRTIELIPRRNGNLPTKAISRGDF